MDVLLTHTGRHPGQLVGRSPYLQPVYVTAGPALIGKIVKLRIAEIATYSLGAEFIDAKAA
jgi:tRNA-2-methylthio-N6-dimethylallyladenosine synthase